MKSGRVLIPSAAAIGLVVLLTAIVFFLWPFVAAGQTSFINCRFGFAAVRRDPSDYSDIDRLHAGCLWCVHHPLHLHTDESTRWLDDIEDARREQ